MVVASPEGSPHDPELRHPPVRYFLRSNPRVWVEARGTSGPARLPSIVGEAASSGPDTSLPGRTQDLIYLSLITPQCRFTSSSQLQAITHPSHD